LNIEPELAEVLSNGFSANDARELLLAHGPDGRVLVWSATAVVLAGRPTTFTGGRVDFKKGGWWRAVRMEPGGGELLVLLRPRERRVAGALGRDRLGFGAVEHAAERRDDRGVELRARVAAQLGEGELRAGRLAVRRSDVIASNASATRTIRDSSGIRSPASRGVAGAVEALVMVADPRRLERHVGGLDDVEAQQRVALHDLVLGVGEPAGLVEDASGTPILPTSCSSPASRMRASRSPSKPSSPAIAAHSCDTVWQWLRV
jgi:hypothetical protein